MRTEKLTKYLKYVFWAMLAVVLLYSSFRGVDWQEFWTVLGQCRWPLVVAAMMAGVASFFIRAARWHILLSDGSHNVKVSDCYEGFTIGKLCDFAVPHLGEFIRCGYVVSPRTSYDKALGTVVLERFWDILVLMVLVTFLLVVRWAEFGGFFIDRIFKPVSSCIDVDAWKFAVGCVLICLFCTLIILFRRSSNRIFGKIAGFFKGLWSGATTCFRMRRKGFFLVLTALLWLMFLFMSWFIIEAVPFDSELRLADALFIMLVGSLAGIVPVPGGFGAFHYLVAIALQAVYSIPFEMGIIFATLSHESQAFTTLVCGGVSYCHQAFCRGKAVQ